MNDDTPETIAAIMASDGQWSFALKECCQRLERERNEWRESGYELYEAMVAALDAKDWIVDEACDPDAPMKRFLKLEEKYGW
jgi:hypothetical protein